MQGQQRERCAALHPHTCTTMMASFSSTHHERKLAHGSNVAVGDLCRDATAACSAGSTGSAAALSQQARPRPRQRAQSASDGRPFRLSS